MNSNRNEIHYTFVILFTKEHNESKIYLGQSKVNRKVVVSSSISGHFSL